MVSSFDKEGEGDFFLGGFWYRIMGQLSRVRYHNTLLAQSLAGSSDIFSVMFALWPIPTGKPPLAGA